MLKNLIFQLFDRCKLYWYDWKRLPNWKYRYQIAFILVLNHANYK